MSNFRRIVKYMFSSPKLYRIYSPQQPTTTQSQYTQPLLETITEATISYIVPITLLLSVYNRKLSYIQFAVLLYIGSRFLRSLSRLTNPEYLQFLAQVDKTTESPTAENLRSLRLYDFEFKYFPTTHTCDVSVSDFVNKQVYDSGLFYYLSWVVAHTFGIRLIYPGLILGGVLRGVLEDGRGKLVVEKGGVRVKISVSSESDSVSVDGMVFDRRGTSSVVGDTLLICCEGNAGFYEIGMIGGALSEGYSVVGWNHPGFGGSTGVPYPTAELTAALGVMDYAINVLGFKESSIIVYGWSIGGFPAVYLASRYPNLKGLLLDATFDDILPLAIPRMPEFMSPLVISTIRNHVNLNNTVMLHDYKGPLRIVRRTEDEIIADPPGVLAANRGNSLVVSVVLNRFPELVSPATVAALNEWVRKPHDRDVQHMDCLAGDRVVGGAGTEAEKIDRAVSIASSILRDFKSTHCTPLPREFYKINRV